MRCVSAALQNLAPVSCRIVDLRGKEVRLTKAGYVLRPGASYSIRIVLPVKDADVSNVRFLAPPAYIREDPAISDPEEGGHAVRIIPFHVKAPGWSRVKQYVILDTDDLAVGFTMT